MRASFAVTFPRLRSLRSRWRPHPGALVAWSAFGLLTMSWGAAFLWLLVLPLLGWYVLVMLIYLLIPSRRARVRLGGWCFGMLMFAVVFSLDSYRVRAIRADGDRAAHAVISYRASHGRYPLDREGMVGATMNWRYPQLRYALIDGEPSLCYSSPWQIHDSWQYDFTKRAWRSRVG